MIKIKSFSSDAHYAFLMLFIDDNDELNKIKSSIDPKDLSDKGIEVEPHITIYPRMDNSIKPSVLSPHLIFPKDLDINTSKLDIFENEDYDVLVCKIDCDDIVSMNSDISSDVESFSEYSEYIPHLTLAYLNKGTGKKYLSSINTKLSPTSYKLSYYVGDKEKQYTFDNNKIVQ